MITYESQGNRVEIYFAGELWRTVSERVWGKKPHLHVESLEELERIERERALQFCVSSLSKKAQHSRELQRKLKDLGLSFDAAEYALGRLKEMGYLDDEDFVERFVEARKIGLSKRALKQKLQLKGVPVDAIDEALEGHSEREAALKFLQKQKAPTSPEERAKLIRKLLSRGFSWSIVQESLAEIEDPSL